MTNLHKQFEQEFIELVQRGQNITLELTPDKAWFLLSTIQLAARHPEGLAHLAIREAIAIGKEIEKAVAPSGALAEVANMGWDANADEEETPY